MIKRRKTRVIKIGNVRIGGGNPVAIQSMTKCDTRDVKKTVAEIRRLEKAGCEIVRVAVRDAASARAIKKIKKKIKVPLVADIHFDFRLALEAIKSGADKIRVNPGNIPDEGDLVRIIKAAKKRKIPIRIGLNSGSTDAAPSSLIRSAIKYTKLFERHLFRDIIISVKSSNVRDTVKVCRILSGVIDYPFHLGLTAAGSNDTGVIKSSVAIGALLLDGIGDTIRVSLTGDSVNEVVTAKRILQALKIRQFGPEVISCPTCGRAQVDLARIVSELENEIRSAKCEVRTKPVSIAIMGCEVNGPGEAKEADIGIAFGKDSGILFKKGKVVKKIAAKNAVKELLRCAGLKH